MLRPKTCDSGCDAKSDAHCGVEDAEIVINMAMDAFTDVERDQMLIVVLNMM